MCTQHKRSERQHTQLAQPYLPTSRLIPSVCFFNAPPFAFSFIVRFAACSAAASVSPSSASACYPCPSCSACCCCPAGSPVARCRLVYCVIVGKWRPKFRLGLISTIALASLLSPACSAYARSLSLPFGLAFVYNHVKLNCFAHFPLSVAAKLVSI